MQYWAVSLLFVVIYNTNYNTNNYTILTTVSSPYHHYHSRDINWVLQGFSQCTSSQSISRLCHTGKWEIKKNEVITDVIQFLGFRHCKHVTVSSNIIHHLTKHTDISDKDTRNVRFQIYCLIYTKFSKTAIVRVWNSETAGC